MRGFIAWGLIGIVLVVVVGYPIGTQLCCNTLTRPDNLEQCMSKIGRSAICPQRRSNVCMVEILQGIDQQNCGKTDTGDFGTWQNFQPNDGTFSTFPLWAFRWDYTHKECVYRKCADACPNGDVDPGAQTAGKNEFEYEGAVYRRQWYCCNDRPMCNNARSAKGALSTLAAGISAAAIVFYGVTTWFYD